MTSLKPYLIRSIYEWIVDNQLTPHLLVDAENTVLVIEHHLDIIKCADHIIDLGPEGGEKGGFVVAQGTVEEVKKVRESYTGQYLKKLRY